jgi:hypothetical protein
VKPVYDAANLIDAHLVRHALEEAGIPVHIAGESLTGGLGDLPLHGLLRVCVPEAAWPEADSIVQALGLGDGPPDPAADDAFDAAPLPAR